MHWGMHKQTTPTGAGGGNPDDDRDLPRLSRETHEALAAFLMEPVPRRTIPPTIRRAAKGANMNMVIFMVVGLMFTIMGLVFTAAFFPKGLLRDWRLDVTHHETDGRVVSAGKTNMLINDTPVYRYAFEFAPDGRGETVEGKCYTTGQTWREGDAVRVLYAPANASIARIEGSRLSKSSAAMLFVLIFPAIGAGVLFFLFRARSRSQWMLRNGMAGEFRVDKVVATNVKINDQTRYRAECRRVDDAMDESVYACASHERKKVAYLRALERTGRTVFGLYDLRDRGKKRRRLDLPESWFL